MLTCVEYGSEIDDELGDLHRSEVFLPLCDVSNQVLYLVRGENGYRPIFYAHRRLHNNSNLQRDGVQLDDGGDKEHATYT